MDKAKIARINALAKKAKTIGLTERETAEREALRKEYLDDMRSAVKAQIASTYVQTEDGAKIPYAEYVRLAKEAQDDAKAEIKALSARRQGWLRAEFMTSAPKIPMEIQRTVCYNKRTAADPGCSGKG